MPYLLLGLAILIGAYGMYRFLLRADTRQVISLFLTIMGVAVAAALFLLAVTGRLPAAIGILVALWPFATGLWIRHNRLQAAKAAGHDFGSSPHTPQNPSSPSTREEALDILGLTQNASEEEIKAAHLQLIKKLHPDQDGSAWLAARINQARDILLK
jgi:DnaJ family protein C protein 19